MFVGLALSVFICWLKRRTARLTAMRVASTVRIPNRCAISATVHCTSTRATINSRSFGSSFVSA